MPFCSQCKLVTRMKEGKDGFGVESSRGHRVLRRLKTSRDRHVGGE